MWLKRKKIWIDRFQTTLALQIACYCVLYQIVTWFTVVFEHRIHAKVNSLLGPAGGAYLSALMLVPVIALIVLSVREAVKTSHRVVGPLYRFRKAIKAITAGEVVEPIRLRDGDYLLEMRDDFNEMLMALERRGAVALKAPEARQDQSHRETPEVALAANPV